jgi:hemerythrin-like domain-containing protein
MHPTTEHAQPATVDTRDMLLIHRVIRREIGHLPALIRAAAGDRARARRLTTHAEEMLDFLHTHHTGEDEMMWPLLRERVELEAELIDRMEQQHEQIAVAVADVRRDLPGWSHTADAETGERMAVRLEEASAVLTLHLAEEEELVLPLVSVHLTRDEWKALGRHGFAAIRPSRRLVMVGHILEEADEEEERRFAAKMPRPARLAFRLVGRRRHAREAARIRG